MIDEPDKEIPANIARRRKQPSYENGMINKVK
jgi:hypothetical protein